MHCKFYKKKEKNFLVDVEIHIRQRKKEARCFGSDPPTSPLNKGKKKKLCLGPVEASPAGIFSVALIHLAGLRSSAVMHQMV